MKNNFTENSDKKVKIMVKNAQMVPKHCEKKLIIDSIL